VPVPEFLKTMFSELRLWRQCARHLYYREIDGKKYGVVLATISPNHDRPALNKPELLRVLAGKREGKIDEGYVVFARFNGSPQGNTGPQGPAAGYEYLGASLAESVAAKLEGRSAIAGRFGEFWTLDLFEIDDDKPL
jgi:hypothetical protein